MYAEAAAPSIDDIAALAETAWRSLPAAFRELAGDIAIRILDFAEDEVLRDLDIEDPFELTGLYVGVDLTQRSIMDPTPIQPRVFLYRRPILDEWIDRGDEPLGHLVAHVLIHEIGHHFGLSAEAMDALLERADEA
ncbi:MAG: metallopeptidase family protein [Hyphomonadaceae bacterium]|nr:metallopeptidase family protein [Hyphomonadaceae bacterium]